MKEHFSNKTTIFIQYSTVPSSEAMEVNNRQKSNFCCMLISISKISLKFDLSLQYCPLLPVATLRPPSARALGSGVSRTEAELVIHGNKQKKNENRHCLQIQIYHTVNRLRSFLVTWVLGHLVTWSLCHSVTRSLGHLVTWSLGHFWSFFQHYYGLTD